MANPIRRLIQLAWDKVAAMQAQAEAKKTLGGVETGISAIGAAARKLGGILAAAFGVRAIIRFGFSAVQSAMEAERVWKNLAGTVEAAGVSFKSIEGDVRGLGETFQQTTIHSDEEFAGGLMRMISLTGDVKASLNNMGLAANVAAQFFGSELEPAINLVSKVMNGNIALLQRMGIRVKDGQEGLEVLAKRSFGAAERAAGTFAGRLKQLNNFWDEFKEQVGDVLIGGPEATGVLDDLSKAVLDMAKWVKNNKDELRAWVKEGINFAIEAMRTLVGLVRTWGQMRGKISLTAGAVEFKPGNTVAQVEAQLKALEKAKADAQHRLQQTQLVFRSKELEVVPQKMEELRKAELVRLDEDVREATDLLNDTIANIAAAKARLVELKPPAPGTTKPTGLFNAPVTGMNAFTEDSKKAEDALKKFNDAMRSAEQSSKLLGSSFPLLEAQASALQAVITDLGAAGVKSTSDKMKSFAAQLKDVKIKLVLHEYDVAMRNVARQSAALGTGFNNLEEEAKVLETALAALSNLELDPSDSIEAVNALHRALQERGEVRIGVGFKLDAGVEAKAAAAKQALAEMLQLTVTSPDLQKKLQAALTDVSNLKLDSPVLVELAAFKFAPEVKAEAEALKAALQDLSGLKLNPALEAAVTRLRTALLGMVEADPTTPGVDKLLQALGALADFKLDAPVLDELASFEFDPELAPQAMALRRALMGLAGLEMPALSELSGVKLDASTLVAFTARLQEVKQGIRDVAQDAAAAEAWQEFTDQLITIREKARLFGAEFDAIGEEATALTTLMDSLVAQSATKNAAAIAAIKARLDELRTAGITQAFERTSSAADQMWRSIGQRADNMSGAFNQRLAQMQERAEQLKDAMLAIPESQRKTSPIFARYAAEYRGIQKAIVETTHAQHLLGEVTHDVAGAMAAAMEGSLAQYAAGKAKQNLLEAAELAAEAAASVIFSLGIATGPLLALAAKHVAIAAGWAALAGVSGGGGASTGGGAAGSALSGARGASGEASRQAESAPPDVNIYLEGPGFDAMNVQVQKVVIGAIAEARKVWGSQSNVRVIRKGG